MSRQKLYKQIVTYDKVREYICKDKNTSDSIDRYCEVVSLKLTDLQKETFINCVKNSEYLICWGRRMSKTYLLSHICVFLAVWGLTTAWRSAAAEQLKKPKEYWTANPLVTKVTGIRIIEVEVLGEPSIHAATLTTANNRSGEYDCIVFDEEAFVPKANEDQLNFSIAMLKNSFNQKKLHASTPRVNSPFHFNYKRLKELGLVTHQNYLDMDPDIPWLNIASIEDDRDAMPTWMFSQEYLAEFVSSSGTVFPNVIFDKISEWPFHNTQVTNVGLDFHPAELGTIYVGIHWTPQEPDDIYVVFEGRQKHLQGVALDMAWLKDIFGSEVMIGAETGGQNDSFYKAINRLGKKRITPMSTQIKPKYARIVNIMTKRLHIDKELTPNLFNDLVVAVWDDTNQIRKTTDYPNHYLDALINSLPATQYSHVHVGFG